MVVIKLANYQRRCPFSKTLIKPKNIICLFSEDQFIAFKKITVIACLRALCFGID